MSLDSQLIQRGFSALLVGVSENVVRQSTRPKRDFLALLGMVSENTIQQSTYLKTLVVLLEGVCIIVNPKDTLSSVTGRVSHNVVLILSVLRMGQI